MVRRMSTTIALPKQLLRSKELAKYLCCTRSTIRQWREEGMPVYIDRPQYVVYNLEDVLAWLKSTSSEQK